MENFEKSRLTVVDVLIAMFTSLQQRMHNVNVAKHETTPCPAYINLIRLPLCLIIILIWNS